MQTAIDGLPPSLSVRGRDLDFPQLHSACLALDVELIQALSDAGIAPDTYPCTEDEDDELPLVWLARDEWLSSADKVRMATLLLDHGAGINEGGPLDHAREVDDEIFIRFLESRGATIDE